MRNIILLILLFTQIFHTVKAEDFKISSPNRQILVSLSVNKNISYTVQYAGKTLVFPSQISITTVADGRIGENAAVLKSSTKSVNDTIFPFVKEKREKIPDIYTELILLFSNRFELHFRVYNDGAAYRFVSKLSGETTVVDEEANFHFPPETQVIYGEVGQREDADKFHTSFEESYTKTGLDSLSETVLAFSPVLLQLNELPKVLLTESDVNDYPGMFLTKGNGSQLKGIFAPYPLKEVVSGGGFKFKKVQERAPFIALTTGPRNFPWRIIAIAPTDAGLLLNDIVYRLAPEPDFNDFSWIKPGKSTEEWITGLNLYNVNFIAGLNTETYKYYIDFAARFGFEYVMLDAGWSDVNDLFKITPGMDMEAITGYAKQKGIGLILWTQALTLEKQMQPAFEQFKKWGIKIVMTDFIDRDDQLAINFIQRFASECAKNKFMCMIHGAPPPKGFSRTYPNMLAREGVLGSEYNVWSAKANPDHDLILPFTRMVAGPMDYEPGLLQNASQDQKVKMGFEKVIAQGTRMHQIAMFVVYESPLQLFSGNLSDAIKEPELMTFLGKIPTVWDETKIIDAEFGKYIVEARRNGDDWFLAAINNWSPKEISVPLSFLKSANYQVEIAEDGINAVKNPHDYKIWKSTCSPADTLKIKLAPGGGFVARIFKN